MSATGPSQLAKIVALGEAYNRLAPLERRAVALEYLFEVAELLVEASGEEAAAAPLADIIPVIAEPSKRLIFEERRAGRAEASNALMARVIVAIDVLIDTGRQPQQVAQIVARQMLRAGAALPSEGGDSRAWRRLLFWRERLLGLKKPPEGWRLYEQFRRSLAGAPRDQLIKAALDGTLWDLRDAKV